MTPPHILTFDEAVADSQSTNKRHLILGNGFSIGCRAKIFHYESLFEEADFSSIPEVKSVFSALETHDFEVAIRALENATKLISIYTSKSAKNVTKMMNHVKELKEILVSTIAGNHPPNPNSIFNEEFRACRKFLSHFLTGEKGGHVFTLNYDLLLYWTLMHDDSPVEADPIELRKNDGFGNDEEDPDADYVIWHGEDSAHSADIHFLHGALHLFDAGSELQKYTWTRKGDPLVDQARTAINEGKYPLFVAEGTSTKKKKAIRHNAYLYQCFKVLTANAKITTHCFFIFGHSLAVNDDHILKRLGRGRFKKLYVGLFGDESSATNVEIINRANDIASLRTLKYPLEVLFFDSASADVWGKQVN